MLPFVSWVAGMAVVVMVPLCFLWFVLIATGDVPLPGQQVGFVVLWPCS